MKVVDDLATELHPRQRPGHPATLDSSLDRDLGFDSLGRVELLARIERTFDVTLPEQVLATMETPRDLLRAVLGASPAGSVFVPPETRPAVLGAAEIAPPELDTLLAVLDWHVAAHPDRPHIRLYSDEDDGEEISYRDLKSGAGQVADGILRQDLQAGESVVIMLPTGRDYFMSFYGVLLAGGVPVPIYPPTRPSQIEDHLRRHAGIVENCKASLLITWPEAKRVAQLLNSQVEVLRAVVTLEELCASPPTGGLAKPARRPGDVAFLQYTSGSTGNPKGVVLTHENLLANIRAMGEALEGGPNDVFVSWLPLYHDMGLIGAWLGSLYHAAPLVIMPPLAFLARPHRWLWAIHRYGGTLSAAPNFAYELCLRRVADKDIEGLDLSSWRAACNGAEKVSPQTVKRFCARFEAYGFRRQAMMPVYGLAESSVGLAFPPLDRGPLIDRIRRETFMTSGKAIPADEADSNALPFVACGHPLPRHQIRIVDDAGRELPERQQGRLEFRGPSATSGYFRNPEQTQRLFRDDWLDSEDLAYIAGGDVYVTGRIKDIIIRAGRNIYPDEFEEAVGDLPGVQKGNVAVFGSLDPETATERLVVLAEARTRDPEALDHLRTQINDLATDLIGTPPDDVVLAPPRTVLKTSSGKIRRAACRDIYERRAVGKPRRALWWQLTRIAISSLVPQLRRTSRNLLAGAYAVYAWALSALTAVILWLCVALLPKPNWRWAAARFGLRLFAKASGTRLQVHGLDLLPPADQPCVYVSNHASYLDGFTLVAALPRQVSFVAKAELVGHWSTRIPLQRIGAAFVERFDKTKGIEDARRIAVATAKGRSPLFFAEGTLVRMPGLLPFHMGAFVTAAEARVPIVPIAIRGTRSILRGGSWYPRRGSISVYIGQPIETEKMADETDGTTWSLALKLREATRQQILRHTGEPDLAYERSPI